MSIRWQSWSAEAFARARAERKPILLSLTAAWCPTCQDMDRTTYADPPVSAAVNRHFVAVRVDADERPDVSDRYSLGGLPTTAFLTPAGELLGGGTYVAPDRMRVVLAQVLELFRERGATTAAPAPASAVLPAPAGEAEIVQAVLATADAAHGGFGTAPKFPFTAPVHLALDIWHASGDPAAERIAVAALDAMGWGGLYDEMDGGFFRYATTADWRLPHTGKMLDVNAGLIRLFLAAGSRLGMERFVERAAGTLAYVQGRLADHEGGGWFAFQEPSDAYYASGAAERAETPPPAVTTAQYADASAQMVSASLDASGILGDAGLRAFALAALERISLARYEPGRGVAHRVGRGGHACALLADQVAVIAAHLDAYEATGHVAYEMMAEELGRFTLRTMWDELAGGFFDRTAGDLEDEPPGSLVRLRVKPFAANCDASLVLGRLAEASGDVRFSRCAARCLAAMSPLALDHGPLAAHYVLALRRAGLR